MWPGHCPTQRVKRFPHWHLRTCFGTCKLQALDEPDIQHRLGIELGAGVAQRQVRKHVDKVIQLCAALSSLEDARAELSLLRVSANASKIAHLLRAAGPSLPVEVPHDFDRMQ